MAITKTSNSGLTGIKYNDIAADNNYMETIASTLVGAGGATSITFSNIPQGYKHLQIRVSFLNSNISNNWFRCNGDTGANYAGHELAADGTSAYTSAYSSNSEGNFLAFANTSTSPTVAVADILDYKDTNKFKTTRGLSGQDRNGSGIVAFRSSLWMNTAAITSLTIYVQSGTFSQYSRFSLYGIKG